MTNVKQPLVERAQRFPLKVPLRFLESGKQNWQEGKTINISHTGILFEAHKSLAVKSELDLEVQFPANTILSCHGPIVRTKESLAAVRIETYELIHP